MYRHIHVAQEKVNNHVLAEEIREKGFSEDKKMKIICKLLALNIFLTSFGDVLMNMFIFDDKFFNFCTAS